MNMDIIADQKHISNAEKISIDKQVKAELIDHLYQGCLPGTVSGIVVSIALFFDYYGYTPTNLLISWIIFFNIMMLSLTGLYFVYLKNKHKFSLTSWEWAYSIMMGGCAIAWVPSIFLLPSDMTRQYLMLIALFLATSGYATGTIGQFRLCLVTLNIMLLPLIIWCFIKGGIFYQIVGIYAIIYMIFMFAINLRSTKWFKESLKLKLENTLVSYQANHDILTDLPNQRLVPQFIEAAIHSVQKSNDTFALLCFSLNRMEFINDSLGHAASDSIIQSVALRLNNLSLAQANNKSDTKLIVSISRKDTFNLLLVPIKQTEINNFIYTLFATLDEPFYVEQQNVKLTASVGVSIFPQDGNDAQSLLINADAAMLRAKQFGGNHVEFYRKEINEQLPKQLELESNLHKALQNHEFQLHYQPLVDLHSGLICGMEALIRWHRPEQGFISPMHFIPLAEETGLILPIGEWVLREACKQTAYWQRMGFKHLKVAVNLSAKQMQQKDILEMIAAILHETHLDARFLELEITETAILDESVIPLLKEFKNVGLGLAVDDFGTGYSGLSYLKRFAIDKLKIDQSFIRDIPNNTDSMTIVSAIIAMAKELKVKTLAEGVETEKQLQFLVDKQCDFIQGYYFSKPLPADLFAELLSSQRSLVAEVKSS